MTTLCLPFFFLCQQCIAKCITFGAHFMMENTEPSTSKRPKAGSWKRLSGQVIYRHFFISRIAIPSPTLTYIDYLRFMEGQQLTRDQCEADWNYSLRTLMTSKHGGLREEAGFLNTHRNRKPHMDEADVFWFKVKRIRFASLR